MLGKHQLESYSAGQQVISLSSGEAEFYSCTKAITEEARPKRRAM